MPELLHLVDRKLEKAQMLLKSLLIIGVILGLALGIVGTCVPWLLPKIFTSDPMVIQQAGRELKFLSLSMSGCFSLGALLLLLVSSKGFGLPGYWCALVGFQWARFFLSLSRLISPNGVLYAEDSSLYELGKLKAV